MLDEDGLTDEPIDDVTPSAIEANNGAVLPDAETEGDAFGGQQAITEQQSHSEQGEVQDNDMYFINSSVTQPQKDNDGQNAYISYLVETEVSIAILLITDSTHLVITLESTAKSAY